MLERFGKMKKVIFDTNIFSYVVNQNLEDDFVRLVEELNICICIPPSILLEATRTNNSVQRVKLLKLVSNRKFYKLRSEIDYECEEVIKEIRRLYPGYRKRGGNIKKVRNNRKFWTKDIWKDCIDNHEKLHIEAIRTTKYEAKEIIDIQKQNKIAFAEWNINKIQLNNLLVQFENDEQIANTNILLSDQFEPWRIDCLTNLENIYKNIEYNNGNILKGWLDPWIKMNDFINDKEKYYDFWLKEVEIANMKRNWIRWAIRFVQQFKKILPSNPYDEQHISHIVDIDLFLTSDKKLYSCLDIIKKQDIIKFAQPLLISINSGDLIKEIRVKLHETF